MQRRIGFSVCSVVLLLAGCPKDEPSTGDGSAQQDGGAANATGGSNGGNSHTGGSSAEAGGSGGASHTGSGGAGGHAAMGVDAGSGQAGHNSQPGSGGSSGGDKDAGVVDSGAIDGGASTGGTKHFCGGFAAGAFPCPGLSECVDDPSDDCDPNHGGADCGGICECSKAATCVQGKHWNGSQDVCDCVADDGSEDGPACGKTHCAKGMECCSPSCGTCVMPGAFCTQMVCIDN